MTTHDFEIYGHTHGNAYTEDTEYMHCLVGAPVVTVIYDWTIRQWRKVKMQPLATNRDRVLPRKGDEELGKESFHEEPSTIGKAVLKAKRKLAAKADLLNYLADNGPQLQRHIPYLLKDHSEHSLLAALVEYPDKFVKLHGNPVVWGLHGQEWKR